jgi:hypothetical protein
MYSRMIQMVNIMNLGVTSIPINLMHNQAYYKVLI